jgi:hypothetical protein
MRLLICLFLISLFFSCNQKNKNPDVSNIKIDLQTIRFEEEIFTIDSTEMVQKLDAVIAKNGAFGEDYLNTILNIDPNWPNDSIVNYVSGFTSTFRPLFDTSELIFHDFSKYENEIKQGLQYLKYYFPKNKFPSKIITYIGPLDGYGDILTEDAFVIGLHHHLGKNASFYNSTWLHETYPEYLTNKFEPSYISINCMKNMILDMYPEKNEDLNLSVKMVEKGKQLYMLSKLLPEKEAYQLIGYTEKQLKDCYAHEASIWDLFIQNNLLQNINYNIIKNYIGESPKTQELGEASPGNIGSFVGWQIVKKYMEKNPSVTVPQLMGTSEDVIFEKAKYKP